MLNIQSKLIDIKTDKCVGVVCINGDTSVPLSLEKAKELGVEDIEIIDYLDVNKEGVALNTRRKGFYALVSKALGFISDFEDIPYDSMGSLDNIFSRTETIWGYSFRHTDFMELDNEIAIRRALGNAEQAYKE